jgi:hypothetical protein
MQCRLPATQSAVQLRRPHRTHLNAGEASTACCSALHWSSLPTAMRQACAYGNESDHLTCGEALYHRPICTISEDANLRGTSAYPR